jgi:hypothetical protein
MNATRSDMPQESFLGRSRAFQRPQAMSIALSLMGALALIAGCGSREPQKAIGSVGNAAPVNSRAASVANPATAVQDAAPCTSNQLTASVLGPLPAPGDITNVIVLQNVSADACTVGGFPSLQVDLNTGTPVPFTISDVNQAATYAVAGEVASVVLQPQGQASFYAAYSDGTGLAATTCSWDSQPYSVAVELSESVTLTLAEAAFTPCQNSEVTVSSIAAGLPAASPPPAAVGPPVPESKPAPSPGSTP